MVWLARSWSFRASSRRLAGCAVGVHEGDRGLTDPDLPADLRNRHAVSALLQHERLLCLRKIPMPSSSPLLPAKRSIRAKLQLEPIQFLGLTSP